MKIKFLFAVLALAFAVGSAFTPKHALTVKKYQVIAQQSGGFITVNTTDITGQTQGDDYNCDNAPTHWCTVAVDDSNVPGNGQVDVNNILTSDPSSVRGDFR